MEDNYTLRVTQYSTSLTSHPSFNIFQVSWCLINIWVLITIFCPKTICNLIYLLYSIIIPWTFPDPPRQVEQQLQRSPKVQCNHMFTSNMSHNDCKSFTWHPIRLRTLETAPDTSCPPSPSRGLFWRQNNSPCIFPPDYTTPAAYFKPPRDSQMFCYALPAIYTRQLAPAHTPTSWLRHLHVVHTRHTTLRHTYVIPCPNRHTQHDIRSATPRSCIYVNINIILISILYV